MRQNKLDKLIFRKTQLQTTSLTSENILGNQNKFQLRHNKAGLEKDTMWEKVTIVVFSEVEANVAKIKLGSCFVAESKNFFVFLACH